jgi:hypothetical protein
MPACATDAASARPNASAMRFILCLPSFLGFQLD